MDTAPGDQTDISLSGESPIVYIVTPTALDFGSVSAGSSQVLPVQVFNNSISNIEILDPFSSSPSTNFSLDGAISNPTTPASSVLIDIKYAPFSRGAHSEYLTITDVFTGASSSLVMTGLGVDPIPEPTTLLLALLALVAAPLRVRCG